MKKWIKKQEYGQIKRELAELRQSEFFHAGAAYKVLATKHGASSQTIKKLDASKNFAEFHPSSVKPKETTVENGVIRQLFDAVVALEARVSELEGKKRGWLR